MSLKRQLRMTIQRRTILEEVKKVTSHPTAYDVYELVRKRLPRISLGTVYRDLELLARWGLVRRLDLPGGPKRFDGDTSEHYHIRCVECGRVDDVMEEARSWVGPLPSRVGGYRVVGHRLELLGVCPRCQRKSKAKG